MAALTPYQKSWIAEIGAAQDLVATTSAAPGTLRVLWRRARGLSQAAQAARVTTPATPWRARDGDLGALSWDLRADVEIDSHSEDLRDADALPPEVTQRLAAAYHRLCAISRQMADELDPDGAPLFTADDIRRELSTPLVRAGTIPDTLVPAEFSEQAIAFRGAAGLYQERIDAHARDANGAEGTLRGLGIAAKTVRAVGTMAVSAVTLGTANQLAATSERVKDLEKRQETAPSAELEADIARQKTLRHELEQPAAWASFAAASAGGVMEVGAEAARQAATGKGDGLALADRAAGALSQARAAAEQKLASALKAGRVAGIAGLRLGPGLSAIAEAKPTERKATAKRLVAQLAGVIDLSLQAAAARVHDDNHSKRARLTTIGSAIKSSLDLAEFIAHVTSDGGNPKVAAAQLLTAALKIAGTASAAPIADGICNDVTAEPRAELEGRPEALFAENREDPGIGAARAANAAALAGATNAELEAMLDTAVSQSSLSDLAIPPGEAARAEAVTAEVEARRAAEIERELASAFGDRAAVRRIFDACDADVAVYREVYDRARPDPALEGKPPARWPRRWRRSTARWRRPGRPAPRRRWSTASPPAARAFSSPRSPAAARWPRPRGWRTTSPFS